MMLDLEHLVNSQHQPLVMKYDSQLSNQNSQSED